MHLAVRMVPLIRLAGLSRPQLATGSFCVFQAISCTTGIHKKVPLILIAHRYLIYHILSHSLTWVTRVVGNHFSLGKSRHIVIWSDFLSLDSGPGPSRPRRARRPVEPVRARRREPVKPVYCHILSGTLSCIRSENQSGVFLADIHDHSI